METPPACAAQPDDQDIGKLADGDEVDLTFEVDFQDDCVLGSVSAYSYLCPDGTDSTTDQYSDLQQVCTEAQNDVPFSVTGKGGDQQTFSMVTGAYGIDGRAPLVGLVPGTYSLQSDDADADSLVVFCSTYDGTPLESSEPASIKRMKVSDSASVSLKLKDRQRIACDFFTFTSAVVDSGNDTSPDEPTSTPDQGDVVVSADDTGSIEFHVATCPAGYDGSDYYNDCAQNGTADVMFSVEGADTGTTESATSAIPTSPGFGIAVIANLPADTYTMSEDVPGDFVSTFVYCADAPGGGDRISTPENGTQQYDLDLAAGETVICDWYITPDQQNPTAILRLTDFTCAPAYGGSSFADFTGDCTDATSDVSFSLSNGAGFAMDKTTNSDGKVRYTDLAAGNDYLLASSLPGDALNKQVAYCATDGGDYIEYTVEDGLIDLDPIADGAQVQCLWYQVPTGQLTGNGSIEIHTSECPPGTSGDYYNACHDSPVGEIDFGLDGPRGLLQNGTSDDNGLLRYTDLPAGGYVISEDPADYPVNIYVVHCTVDGNTFKTTYDDSTGLKVNLTLPAGADVICDWFNIPKRTATSIPAPGGGSVTVILRSCVKQASEIDNFVSECGAYGAGVSFTLTSKQGGTAHTVKTGNDSTSKFTGLADGAYSLEQVTGDWCKAQAEHVDSSGNVLVQNGRNTNVYIYNCGVKEINTLPEPVPDLLERAAPSRPGGSPHCWHLRH